MIPLLRVVMADSENHHAYVEDADEDGNPIDDTRTYVSTAPPSVKEAANVSRTRRDKDRLRRRDASSPAAHHHTDSDSTAHRRSPLRQDARRSKESKDMPKKDDKRRSLTQERPPPRKNKTLPNIQTTMSSRRQQDQSSYFGVSPTAPSPIITAAATASRPRAYTANQRPSSYYGPSSSRPPPASARFWPHPAALGTSFPPQSPFTPPTAPPYQGPYPPPHAFPPPSLQPQPDYFSQGPRLVQRPEYRRPTSALGRHVASPLIGFSPDYDDDHEDGGVLIRKPSLKRRPARQEEDRALMPPPRRPSTSVPVHSPFAPPPDKRRSFGSITSLSYEDETADDESLYSASEQTRYEYRPHAPRRPSIDPMTMYDIESRYEQPALGRTRRDSHYGARTRSTEREVEDKMQTAQRYQARVDGPIDPLTVESIRKINNTPSAGARSNRGEQHSGYAPTHTNRTSVDPEDMTILVRGTATLTIGNAQMDMEEGAEIRIPTGAVGGERNSRSGGGSDRASSAYETERERATTAADAWETRRTTRFDRERAAARGHGRATSRTGSHSRGGGLSYAQTTLPPPTEYGAAGADGYPHQHYQPAPTYHYAPPGSHPYTYPTHLNQF